MWDRLRITITIIITAVGITSLVGVLTASDALRFKIYESFQTITANRVTIRELDKAQKGSPRAKRPRAISLDEALRFKSAAAAASPLPVSICAISPLPSSASGRSGRSNPNIQLVAADENYMLLWGFKIKEGRNLLYAKGSAREECIVGEATASQLKVAPGESISIMGCRLTICGIAERNSPSSSGGCDNSIIFPATPHLTSKLLPAGTSFRISLPKEMTGRAHSLMRAVRRLTPAERDDFLISDFSSSLEQLQRIMRIIVAISFGIGLITLFGASVALMNIMLVSVKERTAEIGLKRALGATPGRIRREFLGEAIWIALKGCLWGTISGIIIGNLTALLLEAPFVIPWRWICSAILLSFAVGILSGYLPAKQAAALVPVEALAHRE